MTDEKSIVHFVVTPCQNGFNVASTFEGVRNRDHHQHVLTCIAVNAVRQLGLIQGMEAAIEKVCKLAYETRIETLPKIVYAEELEDQGELTDDV